MLSLRRPIVKSSKKADTTIQIKAFRETLFGSLGLALLLIHIVFLFLHGAKGISLFRYSSLGVFIMLLLLPLGFASLGTKWEKLKRRQRLLPSLVMTLTLLMTIVFCITSGKQPFSPLRLRHFFVEDMGLKRRIKACSKIHILQQWMTTIMANEPINKSSEAAFMIKDIPLEHLPAGITCQFDSAFLINDPFNQSFLLLGWNDVYFHGIIGTQANTDFSNFLGYPWVTQWQDGVYGYHDIR